MIVNNNNNNNNFSKMSDKRSAIATLYLAENGAINISKIAREVGADRKTVSRVIERIQRGESIHPVGHVPKKPRPKRAATKKNVKKILNRVKKDPLKSMTAVAREVGVSRFTVKRVVKGEGGRSVQIRKTPLVSASGRRRQKK